jgi:DNA-binding NtrC family response regulator
MSLVTQTRKITGEPKPHVGVALRVPDKAQILIVCDNDSDTEQLKGVFREAGLISKAVDTITSGCESAKSGRFQVVFCTPLLGDGSWRGLIDVASQNDLSFKIVLLARTFDLNQWADALQVGAFDVLDVVCDLPKAADTAKSALGTAYLKRLGSRPEQV